MIRKNTSPGRPVRRPGRQEKGLTLIELLVVIAILSILAGLVLPGLREGREGARRRVCLNNLRQVFYSLNMYAHDHAGWFPPATWCGVKIEGGTIIRPLYPCFALLHHAEPGRRPERIGLGLLHPDYLSTAESLFCPSQHTSESPAGRAAGMAAIADELSIDTGFAAPGSYFFHSWRPGDEARLRALRGNTAAIDPGDLIIHEYLFLDGRWDVFTHGRQGMNTLYADGRVEWVNIERIDEALGGDTPPFSPRF